MNSLLRMLFPKWAERRRVAKLAKEARPTAYETARELCARVGRDAIARSYVTACDDVDGRLCRNHAASLSDKAIAEAFANQAYRSQACEAARDGALAGFAEYAEAQR